LDPLQFVLTPIVELEPGARDKHRYRRRHENLAGWGRFKYSGCNVHADSGDVVSHYLNLTSVQSSADYEANRVECLAERHGAADGAPGASEGGEHAVTRHLYDPPPVLLNKCARQRVVRRYEVAPSPISDR
jgi:hypothetical protein